jgi:hypothetical protein
MFLQNFHIFINKRAMLRQKFTVLVTTLPDCDDITRFDGNFFSPLSFVAVFGSGIRDPRSGIRDPGSGMGKNQDPGSGIRDKHPGSATLLEYSNNLLYPARKLP